MTLPNTPDVIPDIGVTIKNWADAQVEPKGISKTTLKTYTLDPAGATTDDGSRRIQICEYEPNRKRLAIQVIDAAIMLTMDKPTTSPDTSTVASGGTGRYLPNSLDNEYCFYGPDAFWINSLTAATRVTVTKEYC